MKNNADEISLIDKTQEHWRDSKHWISTEASSESTLQAGQGLGATD
jgi:hypothetical protein